MIRKVLRILGWTVAGIVGLCLALYAVAVAINWRDREPSATAVRFENLYRDRPAVADADNGYVFLMGFPVAPDEDPRQMGVKRIAWMEGATDSHPLNRAQDPLDEKPDQRPARSAVIQKSFDVCRPPQSPECVAAFTAAQGALDEWMAAEPWLLPRYRDLLAHSGYRETVPVDFAGPLPSYSLVMDGQRLLLLQASKLARHKDALGVKGLLESDVRFWRMTLASADTLITRMIATAALTRHFELGNLVLKELPPDQALQATPEGWHVELSHAERSTLRCMVGEWQFTSGLMTTANMQPAEGNGSYVERALAAAAMPLFQRTDTLNQFAERNWRIVEIMDVPLPQYAAALDELAAFEAQVVEREWFRMIYNLQGNMLLAFGTGDYGTYAARVADIEGVRRAALTAVTLRAANVKEQDVSAALRETALRNPYDDQPFEWNETQRTIVFRGLWPDDRAEHLIAY